MTFLDVFRLVVFTAIAIQFGYVVQRLHVGDLRRSPQFTVCMSAIFLCAMSAEVIARGPLPKGETMRFVFAVAIPIAIGYLLGRARTARQKRREDEEQTPEPTEQTTSPRLNDDGASR